MASIYRLLEISSLSTILRSRELSVWRGQSFYSECSLTESQHVGLTWKEQFESVTIRNELRVPAKFKLYEVIVNHCRFLSDLTFVEPNVSL